MTDYQLSIERIIRLRAAPAQPPVLLAFCPPLCLRSLTPLLQPDEPPAPTPAEAAPAETIEFLDTLAFDEPTATVSVPPAVQE